MLSLLRKPSAYVTFLIPSSALARTARSSSPPPAYRFLRTSRQYARASALEGTRTRGNSGSGSGTGSGGLGRLGAGAGADAGAEEHGLNRLRSASPRELVAHLSEYVVGQERAKKVLAVAVYNHYARLQSLSTSASPSASSPQAEGGWRETDLTELAPNQRRKLARIIPQLQQEPHAADVKPKPRSSRRGAQTAKGKGQSSSSEPKTDDLASKSDSKPEDPSSDDEPLSSLRDKSVKQPRFFRNEENGLLAIGFEVDNLSVHDPTLYDSHPPDTSVHPLLMPFRDKAAFGVSSLEPLAEATDEQDAQGGVDKKTKRGKKSSPPLDRPRILHLGDFISVSGQTLGTAHPSPPAPSKNLPSSSPIYEKSNVLLLGPTGTGKTLLARTLAKALDVPFAAISATALTSTGYAGEDVESVVARLVEAADGDIEKAGRGIIFIDEIDKISTSSGHSKDIGGEGVQQALLKILEGTVVNVEEYNVAGGGMLKGIMGMMKRGPSRESQVDTANVLFIVAGAFVGLEKVIQARLSKGSIGFTSRIAPSAPSPTASSSPTHSTAPRLKGSPASTDPTGQQDLSHLLDQCEPSDLVSFGMIPEFIGRLPITAALRTLAESDLLRVLTEPKNALVKQYQTLLAASGVDLRFTTPALRAIAQQTVSKGTGARGLRRIMENILLDPMYESPQSSIRYVLITRSVALGTEPAHYYSRGQRHVFESALAEEEEEEEQGVCVQVEAEEVKAVAPMKGRKKAAAA
ncbi:hypothetical protein JCM21900_000813 [Sporobolomyces salmonicolor]